MRVIRLQDHATSKGHFSGRTENCIDCKRELPVEFLLEYTNPGKTYHLCSDKLSCKDQQRHNRRECEECCGTGLVSECCGTTYGNNYHESCDKCERYCETVECENCN